MNSATLHFDPNTFYNKYPPMPIEPDNYQGDDKGLFAYHMDKNLINLVNYCLATGRPLLIEGLSGCGKSQAASFISLVLEWRYLRVTVDSRTEATDFLYELDGLKRLFDAHQTGGDQHCPKPMADYDIPGILWWAFDPISACEQLSKTDDSLANFTGIIEKPISTDAFEKPRNNEKKDDPELNQKQKILNYSGAARLTEQIANNHENDNSASLTYKEIVQRPCVILIDELDKADPDIPSSLLVPLGTLRFRKRDGGEIINKCNEAYMKNDNGPKVGPLVVITSNGEMEFSDAFLRRCVRYEVNKPDYKKLITIANRRYTDIVDIDDKINSLWNVLNEHRKPINETLSNQGSASVYNLYWDESTAGFFDIFEACETIFNGNVDAFKESWLNNNEDGSRSASGAE